MDTTTHASPIPAGSITLKIDRFQEFVQLGANEDNERRSASVRILGVSWYLMAYLEKDGDDTTLSGFLCCERDEEELTWTPNVRYTISVVSHDAKANDMVMGPDTHNFRPPQEEWGWVSIANSSELRNPLFGFIQRDAVTLKATIWAGIPYRMCYADFEQPSANSDVALQVGERVFHVNKGYMSTISPYFATLFSGRFAEKAGDVIQVPKVDADDFEEFLAAVHPSDRPVTATNVLSLAVLADRFDVLSLRNKCLKVLIEDGHLSLVDKLLVTDAMNQPELRNFFVSKAKKIDIRKVMEAERSEKLHADTTRELFLRYLSLDK